MLTRKTNFHLSDFIYKTNLNAHYIRFYLSFWSIEKLGRSLKEENRNGTTKLRQSFLTFYFLLFFFRLLLNHIQQFFLNS